MTRLKGASVHIAATWWFLPVQSFETRLFTRFYTFLHVSFNSTYLGAGSDAYQLILRQHDATYFKMPYRFYRSVGPCLDLSEGQVSLDQGASSTLTSARPAGVFWDILRALGGRLCWGCIAAPFMVERPCVAFVRTLENGVHGASCSCTRNPSAVATSFYPNLSASSS